MDFLLPKLLFLLEYVLNRALSTVLKTYTWKKKKLLTTQAVN